MKASEAKQQWGQLLNQVFRREKRVLVEKSGIPVAAVISAEDLGELQRLEAQRARDFAVLDEIGEAFEKESPKVIEGEVARALASVRQRRSGKPHSSSPRG